MTSVANCYGCGNCPYCKGELPMFSPAELDEKDVEIVNLRTALHLIVNAESCLLADAQAIAKNALENARPIP